MHVPLQGACKMSFSCAVCTNFRDMTVTEGAVGRLRLGPANWVPPGWLNPLCPCPAVEAGDHTPVTARGLVRLDGRSSNGQDEGRAMSQDRQWLVNSLRRLGYPQAAEDAARELPDQVSPGGRQESSPTGTASPATR